MATALCSALITTITADGAQKPNIIFIMADDMSWADTNYNGNKHFETPHIDQLTKDGLQLDAMYSGGPNCAPTRSCLITGMYTPRTSIYTPGGKSKGKSQNMRLKVPGSCKKGAKAFESVVSLKGSVVSLAEVLNEAGYMTARMGKWHLGDDHQGFKLSTGDGKDDGTRKHYGSITVAESLTQAACEFIQQHKEGPFFLYLSHWDVHTPIRCKQELVDKYTKKKKAMNGDWNPVYAGMIEQVDTSVGKIRAKIEELGIAGNTLILFTSDNGGHAGVTTNAPLKGAKGSLFEGGIRVPGVVYWKGVTPTGKSSTPVTSVDFMPTFAELAGAKLPTGQPVDGKSVVPIIKGLDEKPLSERAIFWHYPLYLAGIKEGKVLPLYSTDTMIWRATPSSAMRKGNWKLIHTFEDNKCYLYNLSEDPYEKNNLAEANAAKKSELLTELKAWQKDCKAPIPTELNSDFGTKTPQKKNKKKKRRPKKKQ